MNGEYKMSKIKIIMAGAMLLAMYSVCHACHCDGRDSDSSPGDHKDGQVKKCEDKASADAGGPVDDILKNSQRFFYVLKLKDFPQDISADEDATLQKLEIDDVKEHPPVKHLTSSYSAQDHRIRDGARNAESDREVYFHLAL